MTMKNARRHKYRHFYEKHAKMLWLSKHPLAFASTFLNVNMNMLDIPQFLDILLLAQQTFSNVYFFAFVLFF